MMPQQVLEKYHWGRDGTARHQCAGTQNQFLEKLVRLDEQHLLYNLVWQAYPESIRMLIDNRYVFQPYWEYQKGLIDEDVWNCSFEKAKVAAHRSLGRQDTARVLLIIFDRLYVLRNQLVQGGATWKSSVNRNQVRDGGAIIGQVTLIVIYLMMARHDALWGEPAYPVVV